MPRCKKCGKEISQRQYISLKGLCPNCSLLKYIDRKVGWIVFLATAGVILAFAVYIIINL